MNKNDWNLVLKAFLIAIGLVIFFLLVKISLFPVNVVDKSLDMTYDVVNESLDGDNAVANYEWFKTQEADIRALYLKEARAKKSLEDFELMLPEDREEWSRDDKLEHYRLKTIADGIGYQLDDAMEEYNARSSMVNKAIFKDNLPSNITRSFYAAQKLTIQ